MPYRRDNRKTMHPTESAFQCGTGGFSLVELLVTIIIFLILSTAVAVNWVAYMRHQNVRSDAIGLHREMIAARAKALEHGDSVRITYASNVFTIAARTETGGVVTWSVIKTLTMVSAPDVAAPDTLGNGLMLPNGTANAWKTGSNAVGTVMIANNSLNAFANAGFITISSGKSHFLIIKKPDSVRPEMYQRRGDANWRPI